MGWIQHITKSSADSCVFYSEFRCRSKARFILDTPFVHIRLFGEREPALLTSNKQFVDRFFIHNLEADQLEYWLY